VAEAIPKAGLGNLKGGEPEIMRYEAAFAELNDFVKNGKSRTVVY